MGGCLCWLLSAKGGVKVMSEAGVGDKITYETMTGETEAVVKDVLDDGYWTECGKFVPKLVVVGVDRNGGAD